MRYELIGKIAEQINGTCNNQEDVFEENGLDMYSCFQEELQHFDSLVFQCDCCNWWCDTDELNDYNGEQRCNDCS